MIYFGLINLMISLDDKIQFRISSFFAVDMKPVWLTAKLALPAMRKSKGGSIVNICSIHGRLTYPGFFPYGAAKSAVLGLTRNLALDEGKHEIRVNAVSPGYILTDLTKGWLAAESGRAERANSIQPLGRMGEPNEVAKVVTFLLSDKSTYVSGSDWAMTSRQCQKVLVSSECLKSRTSRVPQNFVAGKYQRFCAVATMPKSSAGDALRHCIAP